MYLNKNELCYYVNENLRYKNCDGIGNVLSNIQDFEFAIGKFEILSEEDEDFIEAAIQTLKQQEGKTYTFFKNENEENPLYKYSWCQRPTESNMSLRKFCENGEIIGYMSESLAKEKGLIQVDLNEFIHKFVKPLVKENLKLKQEKQEDEEIDIDIEKIIYFDEVRDLSTWSNETLSYNQRKILNKIRELTKAVK